MRRLLQFGTLAFLLVILLTPVSEILDRWDTAGLFDDTEFRLLALALVLCLVLVVCMLLSSQSLRARLLLCTALQHPPEERPVSDSAPIQGVFTPPRLAPLRI